MIFSENSLTNRSNAPNGKARWHSKSWWTAAGVIIALLGLTIAYAAWQYPNAPEETKGGATSSAPRAASATPNEPAPDTSATGTIPPADQTGVRGAGNSGQVFLSDLPESSFIRQPASPKRGPAKIDNHEYPSSYSYRFTNCGNCTYNVELNLPGAYKRLTGVFGLTDETRHDNVIDGITYFSIYSSTGDPLLPPRKVEYPARVPFDVDVTGVSRVRLTVSGGTNAEYPCWCDARLTR
ncbi:NPCBM/NEW2 domain-containing protein [Amycolatopsis sp. NPDC049868]|uniref:NPCBM/NEW2 domain-containing protein n=1 Tax=Amycolatopsis sp. NPDC049868 TaxID=3363934 RepID=UPI0037A96F97